MRQDAALCGNGLNKHSQELFFSFSTKYCKFQNITTSDSQTEVVLLPNASKYRQI